MRGSLPAQSRKKRPPIPGNPLRPVQPVDDPPRPHPVVLPGGKVIRQPPPRKRALQHADPVECRAWAADVLGQGCESTEKVSEPPVRQAGIKVGSVDELVAKLKALGVA